MARQVVETRVSGLNQAIFAFGRVPENADRALREANQRIARTLESAIVAAAIGEGSQAGLMADTVKARMGANPTVSAGGTSGVGRYGAPAFALLFGSEFGMNQPSGWFGRVRYRDSLGRQYKPHQGRGSYWFFKTVEEHETTIGAELAKAADEVVRKFGGGV